MKAWDNFLRRFKLVRRLEIRVHELEADKADLRRDVADLEKANARLIAEAAERDWVFPPGHFYSPQTSRAEVEEAFARGGFGPPFPGVDVNEAGQIALLKTLAEFYPEQPFPEQAVAGRRYHLDNPSYGHFDGIMLYLMLRHTGARRVIEVGSGFSSAAMLDLNEFTWNGRMQLTFIDPDMSRLRKLLKPDDQVRVTLIEQKVQDVPTSVFASLEPGDVLFIDSSHVSKLGSDVNRLFFEVLPVLKPGVFVHIHDVTGNLDYPRDWFEQGRAWNEQYLLRAFLMYNRSWSVEMFTSWIYNVQNKFLRERMPLCAGGGGGQIWLRKTAE
ncbi:MAG: class I SAM-dependent methyltransferase [Opitutaceae bacterium]